MAETPLPDTSDLRCWAEIDLASLKRNADTCLDLAGDACGLMAIVKADGYGHGLEQIVSVLSKTIEWFGVANVREAERTRLAASQPISILILSPSAGAEIERIVAGSFSASVSTISEVNCYSDTAAELGTTARLHAVIDTGMGRMGALPENFDDLVSAIKESDHCLLEGIETHFPSADEDEEFTQSQIESFAQALSKISLEAGCQIHLGNSAGLIGYQSLTPFSTLVRPGLALYGISPLANAASSLQPALSLKTRVTLVRDLPAGASISYGRTFITQAPMKVATLGVGYGDGYLRHLSGAGAEVIIHGTRCPLLGRVTMDQIVVDISHCPDEIEPGDVSVLIGKQGKEEITAVELAQKAGTIPWEILTGITNRVERVYLNHQDTDA